MTERRASYGYSNARDWGDAVDECLSRLQANAGVTGDARFDVGFIYITDHFSPHADEIHNRIRAQNMFEIVTGTVGTGVCCPRLEFMDEPAMVALGLSLAEGEIKEFVQESFVSPSPLGDAEHFNVALMHAEPHFAFHFIRPQHLNDVFVAGGLTASRGASAQFHTEGIINGGATGVVLRNTVEILTGLTQGCAPMGPQHVITRCDDTSIIAVDDYPALELLLEELNENITSADELSSGRVFVGFPLPNRDANDYVVKELIGYDERTRSIAVPHAFESGDRLVFTRRDAITGKQDLVRMLEQLAARQKKKPLAGLYFSCVARGANLFGERAVEMRLIEEVLGNFPLVGFFGNGEISNETIYAQTGVLTLFY